jgi:hypothetical protein
MYSEISQMCDPVYVCMHEAFCYKLRGLCLKAAFQLRVFHTCVHARKS